MSSLVSLIAKLKASAVSFTNTVTMSGTETHSGKVTFTGVQCDAPIVANVMTSAANTLAVTEALHAGKTVYVTSGTAGAVRLRATLPNTTALSAGARFSFVSGFTGTPTSQGLAIAATTRDRILGTTATGKSIKGTTNAGSGASITLVKAAANLWAVERAWPGAAKPNSLVWIKGV